MVVYSQLACVYFGGGSKVEGMRQNDAQTLSRRNQSILREPGDLNSKQIRARTNCLHNKHQPTNNKQPTNNQQEDSHSSFFVNRKDCVLLA
jgi:hypothetical protein